MKVRKDIQSMCQRNVLKIKMLIYHSYVNEKIVICSCKQFQYIHVLYTLYCGRRNFCRYCLQAFRTADVSKHHIKDCFEINDKQRIRTPTKV